MLDIIQQDLAGMSNQCSRAVVVAAYTPFNFRDCNEHWPSPIVRPFTSVHYQVAQFVEHPFYNITVSNLIISAGRSSYPAAFPHGRRLIASVISSTRISDEIYSNKYHFILQDTTPT